MVEELRLHSLRLVLLTVSGSSWEMYVRVDLVYFWWLLWSMTIHFCLSRMIHKSRRKKPFFPNKRRSKWRLIFPSSWSRKKRNACPPFSLLIFKCPCADFWDRTAASGREITVKGHTFWGLIWSGETVLSITSGLVVPQQHKSVDYAI